MDDGLRNSTTCIASRARLCTAVLLLVAVVIVVVAIVIVVVVVVVVGGRCCWSEGTDERTNE